METLQSTLPEKLFTCHAANASQVMLIGDFTHWRRSPILLHRESEDLWQAKVPLAPGTYNYRFVVDGELSGEPNVTVQVN